MYPNLKLEIFKRGIRQNHLAKEIGLNEALLSRIIHGFRDPSVSQKSLIAEYLKVDPNWLFQKYDSQAERQIENKVDMPREERGPESGTSR